MRSDDIEEPLKGGNVADSVVRIGQTVRKPVTKSTLCVEAFLTYLAASGFLHAPRPLGRDEQGRYVIEYVEGNPVSNPASLTSDDLFDISSAIRRLHDLAAGFPYFLHKPGKWLYRRTARNSSAITTLDLGTSFATKTNGYSSIGTEAGPLLACGISLTRRRALSL